jgi:polar amino acid transport system permease protein
VGDVVDGPGGVRTRAWIQKLCMYRRIVLPQLVLRTAPVLGNQLIICLKDTAFLSIITVRELTSAAASVQSLYFIPFEAFIVAIGLYW